MDSKKGTLIAKISKKDTLFADLLRSDHHAEKSTFSEYFRTSMLTHIVNVAPPGMLEQG